MKSTFLAILLVSVSIFFTACDGEIEGDASIPYFTSDANSSVYEYQLYATTLVAENNGSKLTYTISGTDSASFGVNSENGTVLFLEDPVYDTKNSYTFTATATNSYGSKATQEVIITILDVVSTAPTFESSDTVSVYENQTAAITLLAIDAVSSVTYSIDVKATDTFDLNAETGVVTFKEKPDYEAVRSYGFTATATNLTGDESAQYVTIYILDIDENSPDTEAPKITSGLINSVYENQTSATTIVATDNISDVTYRISGGDSDDFLIDAVSGKVVFVNLPDYETKTAYTFRTIVSDAVGNESNESVNITILDSDENPPSFTSALFTSVSENQFSAITLAATDDDTPITYSITGGDSDSFNVDAATGIVTFKLAPDYESKNIYIFTAVATDPSGQASTQSTTIYILDVDEITQGTHIKKTGQLLSYNATGTQIDDGTIKDDGFYRKGEDLDYTRANDIVTDKLTNRMWQDDSTIVSRGWITDDSYTSGAYNDITQGDTATTYCDSLTLGGYEDWRVPTRKELVDLIDYSLTSAPVINPIFINNTAGKKYSSEGAESPDNEYAWTISFDTGKIEKTLKNTLLNIRCVRTK